MNNFLEVPALKVSNQPLGEFYITKIRAADLLEIAFSEELTYIDEKGLLKGSQRKKDTNRLKEIGKYIDSVEMAFPNSIILAANYSEEGKVVEDSSLKWKVEFKDGDGCGKMLIPKKMKLAAVIDGQHRLNAFPYVSRLERKNIELVCSVYFDLPNSYQAFLFATINSTQKKVDKSLALEQFGFNVGEEPETSWTPEKLAVFLSRKLNIKDDSPFHKHIKVAPKGEIKLFEDGRDEDWYVSTAALVGGILRLISSNPKRDRVEMQQTSIFKGRNREMLEKINDKSPLRKEFISGKDDIIYSEVVRFFGRVDELLWQTQSSNLSYIFKTVGIQASFDMMRNILLSDDAAIQQNYSQIDYDSYLNKVSDVDFSDVFFQASGIGKSRIRNLIGLSNGLVNWDRIKEKDKSAYKNLLANKPSDDFSVKWLWEDEAENEINRLLKGAEWDLDNNRVAIPVGGIEETQGYFDSWDKFFSELTDAAESTAISYMPSDKEIRGDFFEVFDPESIVLSCLEDYKDELKEIGWSANL